MLIIFCFLNVKFALSSLAQRQQIVNDNENDDEYLQMNKKVDVKTEFDVTVIKSGKPQTYYEPCHACHKRHGTITHTPNQTKAAHGFRTKLKL